MGKITCLTSMFARKGKVKVIASAECMESDSVWVSSQKILLSKDSDNLSEDFLAGSMSKDDDTYAMADLTIDNEKPVMSSESISKQLQSVHSIAEWATHENISSWREENGRADPEVSKFSYAEVFEFDRRDLNLMNYEERDTHGMPVAIVTKGGGVVAEVVYEGDEDDKLEKAVIQIEHRSEGSASGDVSPDEQRSGSSADNGTAAYFEFHSNMARGSDIVTSQFDEGGIGDYVSDPGVYHDDNSHLGRFDEDVEDDQFRSQSQCADQTLKKARSEGGLYDLGLISQQDPGPLTDQDLVLDSQGSPSYLNVSKPGSSILVPKRVLDSSHSELDLRDSNDLFLNVKFSDKGSSDLKQKPWWKMFLISHRNIHRERNGLITSSSLSRSDKLLLSGATGYSSDIECYSVSPKLDFDASYLRSDARRPPGSVHSESYPKVGEGLEYDDGNDGKHIGAATDEITRDEGISFQAPPLVHENSGKDFQISQRERPHLRRVEEWINSIDLTLPFGDEEADIEVYSDSEPSAPAASFFRARASRPDQIQLDGNGLLDRRNHQGDQVPDADSEMAIFIARSVNPLSTVAHFSGVGLRLLPPLGVHSNLKTLNLSANALVRIVPGCLPRSLHSLDLSRNKIVAIEGFRDLSRLRVLNLSHNRILRIGHGLANCTSLRELHLAENKISEVEGLHRLLKLSFIDLSFNKLASGKSIGQLAANYNSLQAINLLGNPLHSNLGEEPLRRLIAGIAPHVVYLNRQAMKAVPARDATVDSVARAALGTSNHHTHQRGKTSSQSKPLRRNGKSAVSTISSPRHRDKRSGEKSGTGHGSRSSALKNKAPELPPRHRHSHSRHVHGTALVKDNFRLIPSPVPQSVQGHVRGE